MGAYSRKATSGTVVAIAVLAVLFGCGSSRPSTAAGSVTSTSSGTPTDGKSSAEAYLSGATLSSPTQTVTKDPSAGPSTASVSPEPFYPGTYPDDGEAPTSGANFRGTSRWAGVMSGQRLVVYCGGEGVETALDPAHPRGLLWAVILDASMQVRKSAYIPFPEMAPLRVVSASGNVLQLVDEDGIHVNLDLNTSPVVQRLLQ